jgi:hypothetical protein
MKNNIFQHFIALKTEIKLNMQKLPKTPIQRTICFEAYFATQPPHPPPHPYHTEEMKANI